MANTDRFYNAPEGPQTEPVDELPRRAHYDIHSDPDMFGGLIAKGFQEAGQGLTTAGNVYGQIAADQATNNFMGDMSNLRSGFENTRGQDTMQQHADFVSNSQAAFDKNRASVPPAYQPEYDRVARRYLFSNNEFAASHLAQQSNAWGQSVAQSKTQAAISDISSRPTDNTQFQINSDSMAKAAVNETQLKMGITDLANAGPDAQGMVRNAYDQALARAWYTRIEAVRQSNPGLASQWTQQNSALLGKLGPEVQLQLKGYEKARKVDGRIAEAGAAVGGGPAVAGPPSGMSPAGGPWVKTSTGVFGTDADGNIKENVKPANATGGENAGLGPGHFMILNDEAHSPQFVPDRSAQQPVEGGAASLIRSREGFRSNAYWDVNHWRTGYGSDTVTLPDGSVRPVTKGTTVTQADAERDLTRRARETETKVVLQTGVAGWNAQSPGTKAALTSMAYNYGHLPWDVTAAVRGGSPQDIARTIEGHAGDNGGVNRSRRMQEASIVLGGKIPEGFASTGGGGGGGAPPSGGEMPPSPVPATFETGGGGGEAATRGSAQLGSQPPAIGGAADQGGLSGQTPQSQPSIQQASTGGGGGFGAQPVQDKSGWDVVRDRTSAEMQWIYNHPSDDPELDDQSLAKLHQRMTQAVFAAEADAGTRAKFSQEAVDRSLKLALGINGGQRDPQGGFNALTDAFKRGLIDEPAYERGQAAIARSTGQEDKTSFGPGWSDFVTGKTPANSTSDLQALLAHGDLTWKGYQAAETELRQRDQGDESGYLTQKKFAYDAAENYLKWEMQGPTPGTSLRNPNGPDMMQSFSKIFEGQAMQYRKEHGSDMSKFDLFDNKKLHGVLDTIYSQRQKDKDMGQGGLTKPQADEEDRLWAQTPEHPPAPQGFDQGAWQTSVASPPLTPDKFPLPHEKWDSALRILAANQTPTAQANFDSWFGPQGTLATGPSAADLLKDLKANAPPAGSSGEGISSLGLTPQEQHLYQHHLDNLVGPGGITNADGSRSTIKQTTIEVGGRTYNIPTVWDGKYLSPQDSLARAKQDGLNKYPSYPDEKTAEDRYEAMHKFMDQEVRATMIHPGQPMMPGMAVAP